MNEPIKSVLKSGQPGGPLSPWTYSNPELFELEYDAFFLRRWQFVGHVGEIPEPGDYVSTEIGRDSVFVLRDKDGSLRAFLNVCRHRASRILTGSGHCKGVIRCPYHGWTYRFDGSLMAQPQEQVFPDADKSALGLHEIALEDFHGLLFVRVSGEGPTIAEQFADSAEYFEKYGVSDYVRCFDEVSEVWDVNWKVAWDNYLENYHIPIGHPGLHRLVEENDEYDEYSSGVSYGTFVIRDKLSNIDEERRYQELLPAASDRLPAELRGKWVQFGVNGNLGIDIYPEMLDIFQLVPLGPEKTRVRAAFYGHRDPSEEEREIRELNYVINNSVNAEDRVLCARVQQGLKSHGYAPGPLATIENSIGHFHDMIRRSVPVAGLVEEPVQGAVAAENRRIMEDGP